MKHSQPSDTQKAHRRASIDIDVRMLLAATGAFCGDGFEGLVYTLFRQGGTLTWICEEGLANETFAYIKDKCTKEQQLEIFKTPMALTTLSYHYEGDQTSIFKILEQFNEEELEKILQNQGFKIFYTQPAQRLSLTQL